MINWNRFGTDYRSNELFSPAGLALQVLYKPINYWKKPDFMDKHWFRISFYFQRSKYRYPYQFDLL